MSDMRDMSDEQIFGPEEGEFESLDQAIDFRNSMQAFLRSDGWRIIKQNLEHTIDMLRDQVELTPLNDINAVGVQEFNKGDISRARSVLALPQELFNRATEAIEMFERLVQEEREEENIND